jgi:hypothetical protein
VDYIPEGLHYFVDVNRNTRLYASLPTVSTTEWVGRGGKPRRRRADQRPAWASLIIEKSDVPWEEARQRDRLQRVNRVGQDKLPRVWEARDGLSENQVWPYARKMADGGTRYANGDASEDTQREKYRELSPWCWSIEQCHEECW